MGSSTGAQVLRRSITLCALFWALLVMVYILATPSSLSNKGGESWHKISVGNVTNDTVPPPNTTVFKPRLIVVIVAYMRGGSTFVGELFNSNPDVLYIFEPLHYIEHMAPKYQRLRPTARRNMFLNNFFSCNYTTNGSVLSDFLRFMQYEESYKLARTQAVIDSLGCTDRSESELYTCPIHKISTDDMWQLCQQHKIHATKFVRISIKNLLPYVKKYHGNFKIVHLMRDPRGITNSRLNLKWPYTAKGMGLECRKMLVDMQEGHKLESQHPGTYHFVRYEDLAAAPVQQTELMYKFLGVDVPQEVRTYIQDHTRGSENLSLELPSFTARRNSSETASHWRSQLPDARIREVEKECGKLLQVAGYTVTLT